MPRISASTSLSGPELPERIPWSVLGPEFMRRWGYPRGKRMPEHLEIIGQNGSGKTFFEAQILRQRALLRKTHVVMIATKKDDATVNDMGWPVIDSWPPNYGQDQVIFWVKKNKPQNFHP